MDQKIAAMARWQLQAFAKTAGIRANQKARPQLIHPLIVVRMMS